MAENESGQERTEQATPKRLQEARERGQVPRSRELNTAGLLMVGSGGLLFLGPLMLDHLRGIVSQGLELNREQIFDPTAMLSGFGRALLDMMQIVAPLLAVLFIAALLVPASIGGWSFSTKSLAPSLEKLDPVKGLGRVFGWRGLMELAKALAKFLLVAAVAGALIVYMAPQLFQLGEEPVEAGLSHAGYILGISFIVLSAALIAIAAVDVPFQLWQHAKQLRMTRQEVKDEFKETEGRPEVKGRIRQLQREMAQRRMMEEVPKADVVVTNPTHFAVALRYDRQMSAPKVVAKGVDLVAANIRGVAERNQVPIFEAPPLARALYHSTDLNREIPAGLYVAVAQVLAYVYQLQTAYSSGEVAPAPPEDLPIPDDLLDLGRQRRARDPQDEAPRAD